MRATYPATLIFLDVVVLIILVDEYISWSSSPCSSSVDPELVMIMFEWKYREHLRPSVFWHFTAIRN